MPELKLKTRYKAAGDVFNALLAIGFDPETASDFLNDIKDADVVEVVRCKDCVCFKQTVSALFPHTTAFICDYPYGLQKNVSENDYCCHGERKEQT